MEKMSFPVLTVERISQRDCLQNITHSIQNHWSNGHFTIPEKTDDDLYRVGGFDIGTDTQSEYISLFRDSDNILYVERPHHMHAFQTLRSILEMFKGKAPITLKTSTAHKGYDVARGFNSFLNSFFGTKNEYIVMANNAQRQKDYMTRRGVENYNSNDLSLVLSRIQKEMSKLCWHNGTILFPVQKIKKENVAGRNIYDRSLSEHHLSHADIIHIMKDVVFEEGTTEEDVDMDFSMLKNCLDVSFLKKPLLTLSQAIDIHDIWNNPEKLKLVSDLVTLKDSLTTLNHFTMDEQDIKHIMQRLSNALPKTHTEKTMDTTQNDIDALTNTLLDTYSVLKTCENPFHNIQKFSPKTP